MITRAEVLQKLDVVAVYNRFDVEFEPAEKGGVFLVAVKCPFCGKPGRFKVNSESGSYFCHGEGCASQGTVFDFAMDRNQTPFKESLAYLAQLAGLEGTNGDRWNGEATGSWKYPDEMDVCLFRVQRFDPPTGKKYFTQSRCVGPDEWDSSKGCMRGVRLPLYRLPEVMEAVGAGFTIFLVEGEKNSDDVNGVKGEHFATTAPGGSGRFKELDPACVQHLAGAEVVAVVDDDKPGEKWAGQVKSLLGAVVGSLRFVKAREGNDASDHLNAGHGLAELVPWGEEAEVVAEDADLEIEVEPEQPFPMEAIRGTAVEAWVDAVKGTTEADPAFHAASFMTALGAVIGRRAWFFNGQYLRPALYTVLIGGTASRKTTAIGLVRSTLLARYLERGQVEVVSDATFEGAVDSMAKSGLPTLLAPNEFKLVLNKARQKSPSSILAGLCEVYDGFPIKRVLRSGTVFVPNPNLSILSASTRDCFEGGGRVSEVGSGFWNRCFLVPGRPGAPVPRPKAPDAELSRVALDAIEGVDDMLGTPDDGDGLEMVLDGAAERLWDCYYTEVRGEIEAEPNTVVQDAIQRSEVLSIKLAMMFALLEGRAAISVADLGRARLLSRWQVSKARELFLGFGQSDAGYAMERVRVAASKLMTPPKGREVARKWKRRDLQRMVGSKVELFWFKRTLELLIDSTEIEFDSDGCGRYSPVGDSVCPRGEPTTDTGPTGRG